MGVAVNLFQARLMHVRMGVFGPVGVRVCVFVLDVVVLMGGVRMGMRLVAVLVLVRVRTVVGVLFAHCCSLLSEMPCGCCSLSGRRCAAGSAGGRTRRPP